MIRWATQAILAIAFLCAWAAGVSTAGLRDIHPRPQQMGMISSETLCIPGTFYFVVPNNPTAEEIAVRDAAIEMIEARVFRVPIIVEWSQYAGQSPALWFGTAARLPALTTALDSTEITGLGAITHDEEYQLYIGTERILLSADDLRGLQWGVMSLVNLMSETNGTMYVDRAYIRDWPDLAQRIVTINSSIRTQDQADMVNYLGDLAYSRKMNEVEWNDPDAGTIGNNFVQTHRAEFRQKLRDRAMALYMSADRIGAYVTEKYWQEAVPQQGTKMRVQSGVLRPITNGFNIVVSNGGFETWSGGLPVGWQLYDDGYLPYIAQDNVTRHSGSKSVKFFGFGDGSPPDLDVRHYAVPVGDYRYLRLKYWYKLSGYEGTMRAMIQSPAPVEGMLDMRFTDYGTPTTQDWTLAEMNFATGYADTIIIFVGPIEGRAGTVWVDDVTIETGTVESMMRRLDTPLEIYEEPAHLIMVEGLDYQVTDTSGGTYPQFVLSPRITTLAGGRLAANDSVSMNWYCAVPYQGGRQTLCFSQTEPLIEYQNKIRVLDSLVHPDGFKIHINEVCFSDYDPLCAVRGLTPGELVGSYCRQMYEIVQSFRPGAPMRTYGDPFDIWVSDPRLHPVDTPPWTAGSLQELSPTIEILAMADYTDNLDSSFSYFAANNHPSIMSGGEKNGLPKFVDGALKARQWSSTCRGLSIYGWGTSQFDDLLPGAADLAWNVGPYIVHTPVVFTNHPSTVTIQAEMWTDDFRESPAPILTLKRLRYRLLPSGSWTNVTMGNVGTDTYSATISLGSPSNTGIEYYIETTDTRVQTRRAPYSAPTETFVALFPPGGGPEGVPGYVELDYVINMIANHPEVSWPAAADADWYEVHLGVEPVLSPESATLVARQQLCCPRYLFAGGEVRRVDVDRIHVFAVREVPQQPMEPKKAIE